jgi:chromosome segregation ATPase
LTPGLDSVSMATKVREAAGTVERILLPRLNSIDGELKSVNTRIDSVNTRIDEMDKRMSTKFDAVHTQIESVRSEIGGVRNEVRSEIGGVSKELRGLSEKVDLVKDMERLKVEVAELKRRPWIFPGLGVSATGPCLLAAAA